MPTGRNEKIRKVIDHLQVGLVELFDQLSQLRRLLDLASVDLPSDSSPVTKGLFSRVSSEKAERVDSSEERKTESGLEASSDRSDRDSGISDVERAGSNAEDKSTEESISASVATKLDPIAHEIREGVSSAEQIAIMLEAAKKSLVTTDSPKVENDMDIVLKFLKARGNRGIRPEESENILRRIDRWKLYLSRR